MKKDEVRKVRKKGKAKPTAIDGIRGVFIDKKRTHAVMFL